MWWLLSGNGVTEVSELVGAGGIVCHCFHMLSMVQHNPKFVVVVWGCQNCGMCQHVQSCAPRAMEPRCSYVRGFQIWGLLGLSRTKETASSHSGKVTEFSAHKSIYLEQFGILAALRTLQCKVFMKSSSS